MAWQKCIYENAVIYGNWFLPSWKRNGTCKSLPVEKFLRINLLAGKRNISHSWELGIREILLEGGNNCFSYSKLRNSIANIPW